jgi:hypothetical protein
MLKTLKQLVQPVTIETIDEQLSAVRESIQHARDTLATAIDAPAISQAAADLDLLCRDQLRLEAKKDLARRRNAEAVAKEKADAKRMVDEASDAAIAAYTAFAVKEIEPMIVDNTHTLARFVVLRNKVLETAAAAKNAEALRAAQDSASVLNFFLQRTLRPLTGAKSTDDPTHGRTFSSYLPESK